MKHLKTFESFLNEAANLTEAQETVEIKQESFAGSNYSPKYDLSPVKDALKTFKKPDVKTIVFDIPGVGTITVDAAGITTEAVSSNLKKAIKQAETYVPNCQHFTARSGWVTNLWYNKPEFEMTMTRYITSVLRGAYIYDIKWPIEVPVADAAAIAKGPWARENPVFDATNNKNDFFEYLTQFPQVPIKQGMTYGSKESSAVIQEVVDLSPKTIKVTITGMRSA